MQLQILDKVWRRTALTCTAVLALSTLGIAQAYQQTNLVSDFQCNAPTSSQPCLAPTPDSSLVNPWGLVASDTSPWWVSDNNGGVSTLYDGTGAIVPLVVNIPPLDAKGNGKGTPTGVVFSGGSGFMFHVNGKQAASVFTFVTEDGTIVAWGPAINSNDLPHDAFVVVDKIHQSNCRHGCSLQRRDNRADVGWWTIFSLRHEFSLRSHRGLRHHVQAREP